uniref:Rho-GAP domain-containing protein n=1 Tax=Malurus cyaneus samueli TaxID=2593467 RepID=A0A8C5TBC3_9PASS
AERRQARGCQLRATLRLLGLAGSWPVALWAAVPLCNTPRFLQADPKQGPDLLAVLHQQGPTTEGIFRKAESAGAVQELRQALDRGLPVDMASQPTLLLAVILKVSPPALQLQRLLPGLPCSKAHWQPLSLQDFLRKNLLLLQQLLALLRDISQHESSSRMTSSNLAICLGTTLLS